jgi:uncharacterized protein (TIGR02588 family)
MNAAGKKKSRTIAEGVVLTVSLLIMLGLIGYITYHHFTHDQRPPTVAIKPKFSLVRNADHVFYPPISVQNKGSDAISNLWLHISLTSYQTEVEYVEMTIDYLPSDDEQEKIAVFQNDPRKSTLSYQASFGTP